METPEINEPQLPAEPQGLLLLQDAQYALYQSAKWANFLAIMGFIGAGLLLVAGIFAGVIMSAVSAFSGSAGRFPAALGGLISIFYIIIAVIGFIVSRYLYRYAGNVKKGVASQGADQIGLGLRNLHSYFKWNGVILIVILSIYALVLIGVVIAAVVGASILKPGY